MPVLPVDYPEPFVAVLGTMLYPNEGEEAQRRAFAAPLPRRADQAIGSGWRVALL
jgi:hypothetical protein